jgi:ankyrin repeat protein
VACLSDVFVSQANIPSSMPKVFKTLIEHKADINARDSRGYTPLLFAAERGINCRFLLDLGADPTIVNNKGRGLELWED